ncbi:MAG TPA: adenylyl-sulfate kinase, partial [Nitrospirae bacterium]|nr:adenylyl-sulfate kinase [Nitrospirota bacterium]
RIAEVSRLFNNSGIIVISSFISPYRSDRSGARDIAGDGRFVEVFVDAPIEVCEQRDPKKLYAKARRGEIPEFTGITAPYEAPEEPEVHLRTDLQSVDESVDTIFTYLKAIGFLTNHDPDD